MNTEEKIKFVKEIYARLGNDNVELTIKREEELLADFFYTKSLGRGSASYLVGDDGTFLFCQSARAYDYWKEEFKKGRRSK